MKLSKLDREWLEIREAGATDKTLSDLLRARYLMFKHGLNIKSITTEIRKMYRKQKFLKSYAANRVVITVPACIKMKPECVHPDSVVC